MRRFSFLVLFCLLVVPYAWSATGPTLTEANLETILSNLYTANGNQLFLKPSISISKETTKIAAYYPRTNRIEIEQKAITVCQSFGVNTNNAIAFILAHELAHALESSLRSTTNTSYLAFDHEVTQEKRLEYQADVYGIFNAYLAGYQSIELLPELIETLYKEYNFLQIEMSNYPSLADRKMVAAMVTKDVNELVGLFEGAQYLSAMGEYALASESLEHISKHYMGKEIINNQAVNLVLHALNFTGEYLDPYLFPLELDWNTRLRNPQRPGGSKGLSNEDMRYRIKILQQALRLFEEAIILDPKYQIAEINKVMTLTLLDRPAEAVAYFEHNRLLEKINFFGLSPSQRAITQLAYANALALLPSSRIKEAQQIWADLKRSSDPAIAFQAHVNLAVSQGTACTLADLPTCTVNFDPQQSVGGVDLARIQLYNMKPLGGRKNNRFAYEARSGTRLLAFNQNRNEKVVLQLIQNDGRIRLPSSTDHEWHSYINTSNGSFLYCPDEAVVLRLDQQGHVQDWVKFYRS